MDKIEDEKPEWPRNQFKPGKEGGPGRPQGRRNNTTYARIALSLIAQWPDKALKVLREMFPDLPKEMDAHMMVYISQLDLAIRGQDTGAAKFIVEQAYGPLRGKPGDHDEFDEDSDDPDKKPVIMIFDPKYLESDPVIV